MGRVICQLNLHYVFLLYLSVSVSLTHTHTHTHTLSLSLFPTRTHFSPSMFQLHEHGYRPLNPHDIMLPPPQPPSERLVSAVEEFYETPTEDKPRNE